MIRAGTFREDLFYRLNVVPLRLFPLRERIDDIEPLARSFFAKRGYSGAALTPAALNQLKQYSWRGNVRELFNVLERAAIIAQEGIVAPEHLLLEEESGPRSVTGVNGFAWNESLVGMSVGVNDACRFSQVVNPSLSVKEMEEQLIFETLKKVNGNRTQAAKLLGISVRTLRNKLKQYRSREFSQGGMNGRTEAV
jgi:DNA-binding NtrC family response regulator